MHDKLLHFVGLRQWSDEAVRLKAARHVCQAIAEKEPVTTWVGDDTGFLKQGRQGRAGIGHARTCRRHRESDQSASRGQQRA